MEIKIKLKEAQIHLTDKCNLKCIFCDNPNPNAKDLPDEKWYEIVKDICDLHPFRLTISGGGEPLLRPNLLIKILSMAKSAEVKTSVITNGTLVTKELAKKIVETKCDEWRESIHATTPKLDRFLRGKNLLLQSFRGISYIVEWKKKLKSNFPELAIWMTLTKFGIHQIEDMIKKAASLKIDSVFLRMVNPPSRKEIYPTLFQRKKLVKKMKEYEELANKVGIKLRYGFLPEDILPLETGKIYNGSDFTCLVPFHEIVVFADGRVSPCCNFIKSDENSIAVENVNKKRLKEIWFGEKFENFRKLMLKGIFPEKCKECTPDFKSMDREYRSKLLGS
jgi:radical SAM protein with 4Fe4S-binding SPASM domain